MTLRSAYLVRHASNKSYRQGILQGQSGEGLDEEGRREAHVLGWAAKSWGRFDRLVSSDLPRAQETAEIVAAYVGVTVITDRNLREAGLGAWEGHVRADVLQDHPELEAHFNDPDYPYDFQPFGGERYDAVLSRHYYALQTHAAEGGEHLLVIGHARGLNTFARRFIPGKPRITRPCSWILSPMDIFLDLPATA